jgi:hypothetical protein
MASIRQTATNERRFRQNLSRDAPQSFKAKTTIAAVNNMQPPTASNVKPFVWQYRHAVIRARACATSKTNQRALPRISFIN